MKVAIIGCGVVGAAIAYQLSQVSGLVVTVWDSRAPDQWEATGAALGVLMAVLSPKLKGKHLRLRLESLRLYETLIPELESLTGQKIPYNRHGILQLCFDQFSLEHWSTTQIARQKQGFQLEIWTRSQLLTTYPELAAASLESFPAVGAIYSPHDRQLPPVTLTQALILGAQQNGAQFHWHNPIHSFEQHLDQVTHLNNASEQVAVDAVILAAGLGSMHLASSLNRPLRLSPVLGQALHLKLPESLPQDWPVVNGEDIHLVPLNAQELWVGATVEFPASESTATVHADSELLQTLLKRAIGFYPPLQSAQILRTWQGLRPRPCDRAAPVIEPLAEFKNVLLATGHYRNGVLLAPVTAEKVRAWIKTL